MLPFQNEIKHIMENSITKPQDEFDLQRLSNIFTQLKEEAGSNSLALRCHLDHQPDKFYDKLAFDKYYHWITKQDQCKRVDLKNWVLQNIFHISQALLFLKEINLEPWHDFPLTSKDEYDTIRMIDKHIHPSYLRIVEGVFFPLLQPIAHFSRRDRNKHADNLSLWSTVEEIKGGPEGYLTQPYIHIMRNGIAHGGVSFLQRAIRYTDAKGNKCTYDTSFVVRVFDDMLDTCNGIAAALKVFFLNNQTQGYAMPQELLNQILQEQTKNPWWEVEGSVEAEIQDQSQLTIYAKLKTTDFRKIQWSALQTGILAERLVRGYDRYFLSFRSWKSLPGWASFEGNRLKSLRESGSSDLEDYAGTLQELFYWHRKPKIFNFLDSFGTLLYSFQATWPLAWHDIMVNLDRPIITCRNVTVERDGWHAIINAEIVIENLDVQKAKETIRKNRHRAVRSTKRLMSKRQRWFGHAMLPVGYARIAIFRKDYRRHRLKVFGLGDDLVCTLTLRRIRRIQAPDIFGSSIETVGHWRIAWNRAWLEDSGQVID